MKRNGFTLFELLIVIGILAILVVSSFPKILKLFENTNIERFVDEAKQIYTAAEVQYDTEEDITTFSSNGKKINLIETNGLTYNITFENDKIKIFQVVSEEYCLAFNDISLSIDSITKDSVTLAEEGCAIPE